MDAVYILGKGSHWGNNELRYSLRSVEKYVENLGNVFIVGECPGWLKNIIHLPCPPDGPVKERNIMEKIMVASKCPLVSASFLFINDDHFLLQPIGSILPHYYDGNLQELLAARNLIKNEYTKAVENTYNACKPLDSQLHYDIHCPISIVKDTFIEAMESVNWNVDAGYLVKSLYANFFEHTYSGVFPTPLPDCQINTPKTIPQLNDILKDKPFFSIHDGALRGGAMRIWLQTGYPDKSRFEQDLPPETIFSQDQFDHWRYLISNAGHEAIGIISKDMKGQISLLPSDESGYLELKRAMKYLISALPV